MDFKLNESQEMVRDSAREFAEKRLKPTAFECDEKEAIPKELYAEAAELGFFGIMIPEEFGGLGLDYLSYCLAMEELARGNAAFQVCLAVHNSLVSSAIVRFASDEQKKKYLPKLASGEIIAAYSLSEQGAGSDAAGLKCTAFKDGDHFVVSGTKAWITNGGFADFFIVFVMTSPELGKKGISCLIVEKGTPGFSLGKKEKKLGIKASDTREISFQKCRIPVANLVGKEGDGLKIAFTQLDNGRVSIASQSIGIARAALEEAISYTKERKQFGKAIAEFQNTQFKLADMSVSIEAAKLLTYRVAEMMTRGEKCTRESSTAKLFASQMCNRVVYDALQMHGGNGFVREFPVERYFRDARITEIYEGTSEIQKIIIARELLKA